MLENDYFEEEEPYVDDSADTYTDSDRPSPVGQLTELLVEPLARRDGHRRHCPRTVSGVARRTRLDLVAALFLPCRRR